MQYLYGIVEAGVDRMKIRVTYTLDEELVERLRSVSDKTMIPQAKIVNEAIKEYLDKLESTEK
jgi:predicted DNA-binding protein